LNNGWFVGFRYEVAVTVAGNGPSSGSQEGLYVREPAMWLSDVIEARCTVTPHMHEAADNLTVRAAFEDRLTLHSTAPWLSCPAALTLTHGGRAFALKADLTGVAPGEMRCAEILAVASGAAGALGPVFRVPVTLVRPVAYGSPSLTFGKESFKEGVVSRKFLEVPVGAGWAEVVVKAASDKVSLVWEWQAVNAMIRVNRSLYHVNRLVNNVKC
jgi:tripeptidyl-peptidase-2